MFITESLKVRVEFAVFVSDAELLGDFYDERGISRAAYSLKEPVFLIIRIGTAGRSRSSGG